MRHPLTPAVIAISLAACATSGARLTTQERLAMYADAAGPPVQSFQAPLSQRHTQWTPLGDSAFVLWSTQSQGHLIELRTRCPGLSTASSVQVSNSSGTVNARWDSVSPRTAAAVSAQSCRIERIRPISASAVREAKRELREAAYVGRPPNASPDDAGGPS